MDNRNKAFLILGLGIGLIIANVLGYIYPKVVYEPMTEDMIIERAKELGMVTLRESISINSEKEKEEKQLEEETKKDEEVVEELEKLQKEIIIEEGNTLLDVSKKLYDLELIDSEKEFQNYVYGKELQRSIKIGTFAITVGDTYEDIIYNITKLKKE